MNIFSVVGLIIAIASFILAFYTFVNAKIRMHFIWGFFSFSVATWGLGIFKFTTTLNIEKSIFWWRIAEIGVIFIPVLLVHFVLEFLEKRKNKFLIIFYALSFIFFFFNIFTDYFFGQLRFTFGQFYYITPTNLYSLFILIFLGSAIYSIAILFKEYGKKDDIIKHQIKYLIIAFAVGFIGGATSFLPVYNIDIYPVFNITIVVSALTVVYSMFKYQLLEIKVITTQFLIFTIWFFLFGRILLAEEWKERIIDGILLIMVIFFGTLLIRSVLKEIKT
ncbi:MAG: histidine kinase N-terminal 7TM domain-containing protein, partial [Nanoarchaeota archaeon]